MNMEDLKEGLMDVMRDSSYRKDLSDAYFNYKYNVLEEDEILSAQQFLDIYTIGYKKAVEDNMKR